MREQRIDAFAAAPSADDSDRVRRALMDHLRAKRTDKRAHHKVTLITNLAQVSIAVFLLESAAPGDGR